MLLYIWGGGSTPGTTMSFYIKPDGSIVIEDHYSMGNFGPDMIECRENEATWKEGEPFLPCQCADSAGNELYHSTLYELRSDIERAEHTDDTPRHRTVDEDALSTWLSRVARIKPFVWWDAYSHFDVQRFESPKYAIQTIAFQDRTSPYGSFQQVFARRLSEDVWTEVFYRDSGRYGFNRATIHGFHGEDTVDLEMCFEEGPDAD